MTVSYGGTPLPFPTAEAILWVDHNITLRDVAEFAFPTWPGRNRVQWPWPLSAMNCPPQIGRLHWPVGASRWATFHFLVTDVQLRQIRPRAYQGGSHLPLNLVLDDGRGFPVTVPMYLMPSRPLAQVASNQQLFLLTLVDARYFWWEVASNIAVSGGTTTWATLFSSIGTALGITITPDAISADYLKPASDLTSRYEFIPLLLDAACANVGQRLVRSFSGTVRARSARNSILDQFNQYPAWDRQAGGKFALTATEAPAHDLQALVPASVVVTFPRTDSGVPSTSLYAVTTTLASLALAEFSGVVGHAGSKFFHDEPVATYTGGADPTNIAELTTLAARIATDWYLWKLNKLDVVYCGAVPWTPEGMGDIIYDWRAGTCQTRVTPCATLNSLSEELNHYGTNGTGAMIVPYRPFFAEGIVTDDVTAIGTVDFGTSGTASVSPTGILSMPTLTVAGPPTWTPVSGYPIEISTTGVMYWWDGGAWVVLTGTEGPFGGDSFGFIWDTGTSDADPGSGKIRANSGTPSAVTKFYASYADENTTDITAWLSSLYAIPAKIYKADDMSQWTIGTVTGTTGGIGYRKLSFTYLTSAGGFAGGDRVILTIGGQTGSPGTLGGDSFLFLWNTSTSDADPGSGYIGDDNATPASVTQIFVSDDGSSGYALSTSGGFSPSGAGDITAWLDSVAVGTTIKLFKATDATKWMVVAVTVNDALTDYHRLTVTYIDSNSTFSANDLIVLTRGGVSGGTTEDVTVGLDGGGSTVLHFAVGIYVGRD